MKAWAVAQLLVLTITLLVSLAPSSAAPFVLNPGTIKKILLRNTKFTFVPIANNPNVRQIQCFDAWDTSKNCYKKNPITGIYTDPVCTAGTCKPAWVKQDGQHVTLTNVPRNPAWVTSAMAASKIERIDSTHADGVSIAGARFSNAANCLAWLGGSTDMVVHNSGQNSFLRAECAASAARLEATLTGDLCMGLYGVRSPVKPLHVNVTGNAYFYVTVTKDSRLPEGIELTLTGTTAKVEIYVMPGVNNPLKIVGYGNSDGPAVIVSTCRPSSAAGAPTVDYSVDGRALRRKWLDVPECSQAQMQLAMTSADGSGTPVSPMMLSSGGPNMMYGPPVLMNTIQEANLADCPYTPDKP